MLALLALLVLGVVASVPMTAAGQSSQRPSDRPSCLWQARLGDPSPPPVQSCAEQGYAHAQFALAQIILQEVAGASTPSRRDAAVAEACRWLHCAAEATDAPPGCPARPRAARQPREAHVPDFSPEAPELARALVGYPACRWAVDFRRRVDGGLR